MAKEEIKRIRFTNDDFGPNLHFKFDMIIIRSSVPFPSWKGTLVNLPLILN